jgi:hypothetical protein
MEGDVYQVQKEDMHGPWDITNILQPRIYENDKGIARSDQDYQAHTLQILVQDLPGVLQQVGE